MRVRGGIFIVFIFMLLQVTYADEQVLDLNVPWPSNWQIQKTQIKQGVIYENARLQSLDKAVQALQITAINLSHSPKSPTPESLSRLVSTLRDQTLKTAKEKEIPLQTFVTAQGYYYAATDNNPKAGEFTQMIEGVMLNSGYMINFTLLTYDANSADAKAMIAALDKLSIK